MDEGEEVYFWRQSPQTRTQSKNARNTPRLESKVLIKILVYPSLYISQPLKPRESKAGARTPRRQDDKTFKSTKRKIP